MKYALLALFVVACSRDPGLTLPPDGVEYEYTAAFPGDPEQDYVARQPQGQWLWRSIADDIDCVGSEAVYVRLGDGSRGYQLVAGLTGSVEQRIGFSNDRDLFASVGPPQLLADDRIRIEVVDFVACDFDGVACEDLPGTGFVDMRGPRAFVQSSGPGWTATDPATGLPFCRSSTPDTDTVATPAPGDSG